MTSDLVERLRYEAQNGVYIAANQQANTRDLHQEAAAEIERLQVEIDRLNGEVKALHEMIGEIDRQHNMKIEAWRLKEDKHSGHS